MSSIAAGTTTTTGYVVTSDSTGALVLKTGSSATTAVTIDTSQNVGIGTASPSAFGILVAKRDQTADTAIAVSNTGTTNAATSMSFVLSEAGTAQGWFRRYRDGSGNTEIGFSDALLFTGNVTGTKTERARIDSSGNATFAGNVNITAGSKYFYTGSLDSRLWTPGLAIGTGTYAGLYGPALTYLAQKSGSTWISGGGGTAGALTIDEGHFSFARSQGVGGPGTTLIWTTFLESDTGGNFSFNSTGFTKVASGTTAARPTATAGRLRWNTTLSQLEVADGTTFEKVLLDTVVVTASGGTITTDGDYKVHTFTSSGTFTVTTISGGGSADFEVLIVGAGGAGGFYLGGGGGSGAMITDVVKMTAASYTVTVGSGGNATGAGTGYSGNGNTSSILGGLINLYALGGGAGGNGTTDAFGANGSANSTIGSGGGGGSPFGFTFSASSVHASFGGPAGINGSGGGFGTLYSSLLFTGGGGGGGALGPGVAPNVGNGPVGAGGFGGTGRPSSITGSNVFYGGGGGGGYGTYLANGTISGGNGGGGHGVGTAASGANLQAAAGTANRGGGGGGGQAQSGYQAGGNGGSGIVIIRYKFQ